MYILICNMIFQNDSPSPLLYLLLIDNDKYMGVIDDRLGLEI